MLSGRQILIYFHRVHAAGYRQILKRHRAYVEVLQACGQVRQVDPRQKMDVRIGRCGPPALAGLPRRKSPRARYRRTSMTEIRACTAATQSEIQPVAKSAEESDYGVVETVGKPGRGRSAEQVIVDCVRDQNYVRPLHPLHFEKDAARRDERVADPGQFSFVLADVLAVKLAESMLVVEAIVNDGPAEILTQALCERPPAWEVHELYGPADAVHISRRAIAPAIKSRIAGVHGR